MAAPLLDEVNELETPMARFKMDSRLERSEDRDAECALAVDESEGRCWSCFFGDRFLPIPNLLAREEERRSLPEPVMPCGGGEAEAEARLAAAADAADGALPSEAPAPPKALNRKFSEGTERGRSELLRLRPTSQSNGSYSELEECSSLLEA